MACDQATTRLRSSRLQSFLANDPNSLRTSTAQQGQSDRPDRQHQEGTGLGDDRDGEAVATVVKVGRGGVAAVTCGLSVDLRADEIGSRAE